MNALANNVGGLPLTAHCAALAVPPSTVYRHRRPPRARTVRARPARALSADESGEILGHLHSDRFVDSAPAEVVHTLLADGIYLGSERTMYRNLAANDELRERRRQRTHPIYAKPELMASAPNQVCSWDITRLRTTRKWEYLYLYVVMRMRRPMFASHAFSDRPSTPCSRAHSDVSRPARRAAAMHATASASSLIFRIHHLGGAQIQRCTARVSSRRR